MKGNIVSKVIIRTHRPMQLFAALLGCFIGFLLVVTSIQNYYNFNYILNDKSQVISSQFLVINKKVSILNSINLKSSSFTEKQINEIKSLPSVEKLSAFNPNRFQASAFLQLSTGDIEAELKTDLFLESVDDDFIDVTSDDWEWQLGNEVVPVILPTDFINLYNFTYAPARGFPQISKSTAQLFGFKIIIDDHQRQSIFKGKIIGFSNRISSMIVPISFMNYANNKFGSYENNKSFYRLIVEVKPSQLSAFQQFLDKKGLETNEELLKGGKLSSLLEAILFIVLILGLLMILNSFSGFLLYLKLIITKSQYELETLLRLGYEHRRLTKWYANGLGLIVLSILVMCFASLHYIQTQTNQYLNHYGFDFPSSIHKIVYLSGIVIMVLLYTLFYFSIKKQIYNFCLPKKEKL